MPNLNPHDSFASRTAAARFGYRVAVGTALTTRLTFAIAVRTPPLSGQLCEGPCFTYPYLGIASRFPRDYYWMFAAIPATFLYLATMALSKPGPMLKDGRPLDWVFPLSDGHPRQPS
jgi:hypothetical protein